MSRADVVGFVRLAKAANRWGVTFKRLGRADYASEARGFFQSRDQFMIEARKAAGGVQ